MTKLVLIGAGLWGGNILNTLRELPAVEVRVLEKGDNIDPASPQFGGADGILVATPGSTHADIALPFIKQGLPTYIEKPMTTDLASARKLERATQKYGGKVFVGHIHLYNPAFLKAKEETKKIGKIQMLHFEGMAMGPVRDDMSVLWDWGPHGVSMAMDLLGDKPKTVQAWGMRIDDRNKVDDVVQSRYMFVKGVEMLMTNSWVSPEKRTKLTIIGSKGNVVFDDRADKKVALYTDGKVIFPRYSTQAPLKIELESFVTSLKGEEKIITNAENGLLVVEALAAAQKSIELDGGSVQC